MGIVCSKEMLSKSSKIPGLEILDPLDITESELEIPLFASSPLLGVGVAEMEVTPHVA